MGNNLSWAPLFLAAALVLPACQSTRAAPVSIAPAMAPPAAPAKPAQANATPPTPPTPPATPHTATTIILPPIDPKTGISIPPAMIAALQQLTDDDFRVREGAVDKIQQAMAHQFQQMVALQNLILQLQDGLSRQLGQLTQVQSPEGNAPVAGLMEFNSALSRWAIAVMSLPQEQRDDLLHWGLKDANLPLVARAFARSNDVRAQATHDIAKLSGKEADWMLVQLLNDISREVELSALDAAYDRKPSAPIVEALWSRATAAAMNQYHQHPNPVRIISIHGRTVQLYDQDFAAAARMQDPEVAVDVLLKYHDSSLTKRLNDMFAEMQTSLENPNDSRWRTAILTNYGEGAQAIARLTEAYKPPAIVPFLLKVLTTTADDNSNETTIDNQKERFSTRIEIAALLVQATGQDPDDFNLKKYANWGGRWMLKGGMPEEDQLIKKLQTWAKAHPADQTAPSTAPGPAKPAP